MKLRVREYGKNVYQQTLNGFKILRQSEEDYTGYTNYFDELLYVVAKHVNATIILEVTEESTCMTLYLNKKQMTKAELIKEDLLGILANDIEQVGFKETSYGMVVNIYDFFYDYNY